MRALTWRDLALCLKGRQGKLEPEVSDYSQVLMALLAARTAAP